MWCTLGWPLSRSQVLTRHVLPGSSCFHRSQRGPFSWIAQLWDALDHNQSSKHSLSRTLRPFTFLGFLNPLFSRAHVVVILITGHSDFKKTSFSVLCHSAFSRSSSLGKRMGCLLCLPPSCIFNDLQGKDFFPLLLFFFYNKFNDLIHIKRNCWFVVTVL